MINEDAPTMSAGTGGFSGSANASGPVAGFDPILGKGKVKKRRRYAMSNKEMMKTEGAQKDTSYLPFLISYDGAEQYVLYSKSEAALKIDLLTNAVARVRLATPDSDSSNASSSSLSSDLASESISLPMNARAFLELLFL